MTPIFVLYKRWQQRQATIPKKEKPGQATTTATTLNPTTTKNTTPPAILRPSELYFQKLTPLLNKHNIKATQSNRKEWPLQVLKEVLTSLTGECLQQLQWSSIFLFFKSFKTNKFRVGFFLRFLILQRKHHVIYYPRSYGLYSPHISNCLQTCTYKLLAGSEKNFLIFRKLILQVL